MIFPRHVLTAFFAIEGNHTNQASPTTRLIGEIKAIKVQTINQSKLPLQSSTKYHQNKPMTYFEFYDIPISFLADEAALRKTYYANSKKYHPDFYTLASEEEQAKALEMSTLNNEAFKTLSDPDRRMKYILDLKGAIGEEGKNQIPQDFLMEMMDINEALMELEFDFEEATYKKVWADLEAQEEQLYQEVLPVLKDYKEGNDLTPVAEYYFKKRYLLRIRENLEKQEMPRS